MYGPVYSAVNIDPSGELTVEEGDNVTVTCTSNVAGALLQLLILMDRFTSSHSVVASAEDTVLSHTFYFIRGSADGRYWCTLSDLRSENLEISVAGRPRMHTNTHTHTHRHTSSLSHFYISQLLLQPSSWRTFPYIG